MSEHVEEVVRESVYRFAESEAASGKSRAQVEQALHERGLDGESARIVASHVFRGRSEAPPDEGTKAMIYGAMWFIGGVLVTALSYGSARGGGRYVVAYGAIVFGAIKFLRGAAQRSRD